MESVLKVPEFCGFLRRGTWSDLHFLRITQAAWGEQTDCRGQERMNRTFLLAIINSQYQDKSYTSTGLKSSDGSMCCAFNYCSLGAEASNSRQSSLGPQGKVCSGIHSSSSSSITEISFLKWLLNHFYVYRKFTMILSLKTDRITSLPQNMRRKNLHSKMDIKTY